MVNLSFMMKSSHIITTGSRISHQIAIPHFRFASYTAELTALMSATCSDVFINMLTHTAAFCPSYPPQIPTAVASSPTEQVLKKYFPGPPPLVPNDLHVHIKWTGVGHIAGGMHIKIWQKLLLEIFSQHVCYCNWPNIQEFLYATRPFMIL